MSPAERQPILPAELHPEQLMMGGTEVWSEASILIHPTGVLRDAGQDSGLGSPFLEPYYPQTIPSQTLHCDGSIVTLI
jgi:hypothetical protein